MENATQRPFAVVTGASSGIGLELARQFAQHGFDLLITAQSDLRPVQMELESTGAKVETCLFDLRSYDGVEALYGRILDAGRPVAAIAINAGVGVSGDFTRETDLKQELDMIQLNVVSTVHLAKRVAKLMVQHRSGRILITSSIAATMPNPYLAVYGATKAFDLSFAEGIREELKDTGVTVTALMPGATDTNFFERAGMEDTKAGTTGRKENDPADVAKQGFEALMSGKDHVIAASVKTKMQGLMGRFFSEPAKAAQARKNLEPGTAEPEHRKSA